MDQERWADVDRYITETLLGPDPALDHALAASALAGLPAIQVAPNQGRLLWMMARLQGARRILEIGTLGGYSTIWLARALPEDGRLITLESEARHAEVARANLARAGVDRRVEVRVGLASDSLASLDAEGCPPFDLFFIDADKVNIPHYFTWALRHSRAGSLIVVDNVVREGALADSANQDPSVLGVRRLHEMLAAEPRVSATTIQMVGVKGYDGMTLALVT